MPRPSAGLLLYRRSPRGLEVLLAHPGGPLWAKRDEAAWSIPKGEVEQGEEPRAAAIREFIEETGFEPSGELVALTPVRQPGGKLVHAWALEQDLDPAALRSNTFVMEWPPRSGRRAEFPEIDRFEWFPIAPARRKILKGQAPLLGELESIVRTAPG